MLYHLNLFDFCNKFTYIFVYIGMRKKSKRLHFHHDSFIQTSFFFIIVLIKKEASRDENVVFWFFSHPYISRSTFKYQALFHGRVKIQTPSTFVYKYKTMILLLLLLLMQFKQLQRKSLKKGFWLQFVLKLRNKSRRSFISSS